MIIRLAQAAALAAVIRDRSQGCVGLPGRAESGRPPRGCGGGCGGRPTRRGRPAGARGGLRGGGPEARSWASVGPAPSCVPMVSFTLPGVLGATKRRVGQGSKRRSRSRPSLELACERECAMNLLAGATRTYFDVALAVKAGADVIVLDGMEGGTAASLEAFIEHVGIPSWPRCRSRALAAGPGHAPRGAAHYLGGSPIRRGRCEGARLGADAVSIGVAAIIALGDNSHAYKREYEAIGSSAGYYDDWHEGRDPTGISTQDERLARRFFPELGGRRLANYLRAMVLEAQTLARACGKSHLHNLEPEDLVALTFEAAAMAKVPVAGTSWIPGRSAREP